VLERLTTAQKALRAGTNRNVELEAQLGVLKLDNTDKLEDLLDKYLAEIAQVHVRIPVELLTS
jgi:hypothetical protein